MRFQIPQFIETEDKIVGPFSLKQFLLIGGGVGISLILYFVLNELIWFFVSAIIVSATVALAFVKVNGRSLPIIVFAALSFTWKPHIYVWQPEHPQMPKNEESLQAIVGNRFSLESIVSGLTLRHASEKVKIGTTRSKEKGKMNLDRAKERYQVFEHIAGDRQAARRIDYR